MFICIKLAIKNEILKVIIGVKKLKAERWAAFIVSCLVFAYLSGHIWYLLLGSNKSKTSKQGTFFYLAMLA